MIREFADYREANSKTAVRFHSRKAGFLDRTRSKSASGSCGRSRSSSPRIGARPVTVAKSGRGRLLTSDDVLKETRQPKSLLVLGGGPVAVEFAQFFQRLGTQVTLLQRSPHLLRDSDVTWPR